MIIDTGNVDSIAAFLVAVLMAIIAWWQNRQKNTTVAQVAALTPGTPESTSSAVIAQLPARSWKMDPATLDWITFGESDADKANIIQQVHDAEAKHLTDYQIVYSKGYYNISYGLIKSSARGK